MKKHDKLPTWIITSGSNLSWTFYFCTNDKNYNQENEKKFGNRKDAIHYFKKNIKKFAKDWKNICAADNKNNVLFFETLEEWDLDGNQILFKGHSGKKYKTRPEAWADKEYKVRPESYKYSSNNLKFKKNKKK